MFVCVWRDIGQDRRAGLVWRGQWRTGVTPGMAGGGGDVGPQRPLSAN